MKAVEDAGTVHLSGEVVVEHPSLAPSLGEAGFITQAAYAVCATRYPTFRYLEQRGSGSCSAKCADSETESSSCLAALGLGGNTTPWADSGCGSTTSSIVYCCCSW